MAVPAELQYVLQALAVERDLARVRVSPLVFDDLLTDRKGLAQSLSKFVSKQVLVSLGKQQLAAHAGVGSDDLLRLSHAFQEGLVMLRRGNPPKTSDSQVVQR